MATIEHQVNGCHFCFNQSHFVVFGFAMERHRLSNAIYTACQWKGNGIALESRMPFIVCYH